MLRYLKALYANCHVSTANKYTNGYIFQISKKYNVKIKFVIH